MVGEPFALPLPKMMSGVVERLLGLTTLRALYKQRQQGNFVAEALRLLRIEVTADGDIGEIPKRGAVVVVANHPSGGLDGLALAHLVQQRRPDVKILANQLLTQIPELRELIIGVNTFSTTGRENAVALRRAGRWLSAGGALVVFPAGEVSNVARRDSRSIDGVWKRGVLKLVEWSDASIVPSYIHARPGRLLRLAGRIHPLLRTALLARELITRRGQSLLVSIGTAIPAARIRELASPDARLSYLRARTFALERRPEVIKSAAHVAAPLAGAESADDLAAELRTLSPEALLLRSGSYEVYFSAAAAVPAVVREIGRLREATFRLVDEGTGRARDLDAFDPSYRHLFVWDVKRRCVVGAYRLGFTDQLAARHNAKALYTRTLFQFGRSFVSELGAAIELGRSFVRSEYQRDSNALLLLWRGIGEVVAREPRYRLLFGAVSVSANYHPLTRQLLTRVLSGSAHSSPLASRVQPRRPLPAGADATRLVESGAVTSLADAERFVREIEGRGLPVLLRQYLKLNARVLGFSVDPGFGNALDGLVLVDLLEVPPALLQRYLGRASAAAFLSYHAATDRPVHVHADRAPVRATPAIPISPGHLAPVSTH